MVWHPSCLNPCDGVLSGFDLAAVLRLYAFGGELFLFSAGATYDQ